MISWRHSFKRLSEEYEIAKKKKQALDNLFETGRISKTTRDSFNDELVAAIVEIEKQQKDLLAKMQLKMHDLESQIKTLETLLANYEIQHVVGEIDDEIYQHEINLLSTGLDTAKHELDLIIEAANQLCPPAAPAAEPSSQSTDIAPAVEAPTVETVPAAPVEVEVPTEPCTQEPAITLDESAPIEAAPAENAEAAPIEAPETPVEIAQEPVAPIEEAAPAAEQPSVENAEAAAIAPAPQEDSEVAPVETASAETVEVVEAVSEEPTITLDEAPLPPEPASSETDETLPAEAAPVENTETAIPATEEATGASQETIIVTEEATSEGLPTETVEEAPAETLETVEIVEETPEEPVIILEETAPAQSSDESESTLITEEPQFLEDLPPVVEEVTHTANPRNAPQEAQPEITAEPIVEQVEYTEDTQAAEDTAENTEDQEE